MSGTPSHNLQGAGRPVALRVLGRVVYWLAVFVISLAILYALIRYLESRDNSQVGNHSSGATTQQHKSGSGGGTAQPQNTNPGGSAPQPANPSGGGGAGQQQHTPTTLGPAG
jgi:hypothetical protein